MTLSSPSALLKPFSRRAQAVLAVLAVIGVFAVERTAPQDDGAQYWVMAGRLASSADPLYVAAVDHKGPLWAMAYRFAWAFSGDQRWFWFIIAVLFVGLASLTGWCVYRIAKGLTGTESPARVAGLAISALIIFGRDGYSLSLYGRNITSALTAVAALLVLERMRSSDVSISWRRVLAAGALLGLATQTVLTSAAATVALALAVAIAGSNRRQSLLRSGSLLLVALAVVLTAPIWYSVRGAGPEFSLYWWDYNQLYAAANPTSISGRVVDAVREVGFWGLTRIYPLVALAAFGVLGVHMRRTRSISRPAIAVMAWWLAELAAVVAPDRYFDHYWILMLAPTAILGVMLWEQLGDAGEAATTPAETGSFLRRSFRTFDRLSFPRKLTVIPIVGIALLCLPSVASGASLALSYRGPESHLADRDEQTPAAIATLRGIVEATVAEGEPILAWSPAADTHTFLNRPAATRFDRRQWMTGEVLGGENLVVLPDSLTNAELDLEVSQPKLIVETLDVPIDGDSPVAAHIRANYVVIYESQATLPARVYARVGTPLLKEAPGPDVRCWFAPELVDGTVRLQGAGLTGSFVVSAALVSSRRDNNPEPVDSGLDAQVQRPGPGPASLVVGQDFAVLWGPDDVIVGAMHLPHGIDHVLLDGGADALRSQPCG